MAALPVTQPKATSHATTSEDVDETWGEIEEDLAQRHAAAAPLVQPQPQPPPQNVGVSPAPPGLALSAVDLRAIVKEMIDQATATLQRRIEELERRPATVAQVLPAPPTPTAPVVSYPAAIASPAVAPPRAPVIAAAAPAPRAVSVIHPAPLLDLAEINRSVSVDVDISGFDGGRRKRRAVAIFVVFVVLVFGGLFALLASSYSHPQ